jgi:hypothetical protein
MHLNNFHIVTAVFTFLEWESNLKEMHGSDDGRAGNEEQNT